MKTKLLSLIARTPMQPFWWGLYRLSIGGLGYMNADRRCNGEDYFLSEWAKKQKHEAVIVDAGANEGDFTRGVLSRVQKCKVFSFEPHPVTFRRLSARIGGDPRVTLENKGLGETEESLRLFDYANSEGSGHASFVKETFTQVYPSDTQTESAKVVRLDDYMRERGVSCIDLLKIDVEGFEKEVILGASGYLREGRVTCIQMEFNAHNLLSQLSIAKLSELLPGYDIFRMLPDGLAPIVGSGVKYNSRVEIFKYCNLVAVWRGGR